MEMKIHEFSYDQVTQDYGNLDPNYWLYWALKDAGFPFSKFNGFNIYAKDKDFGVRPRWNVAKQSTPLGNVTFKWWYK